MWDERIDGFVESERSRGLRERSLEDLRRQLGSGGRVTGIFSP